MFALMGKFPLGLGVPRGADAGDVGQFWGANRGLNLAPGFGAEPSGNLPALMYSKMMEALIVLLVFLAFHFRAMPIALPLVGCELNTTRDGRRSLILYTWQPTKVRPYRPLSLHKSKLNASHRRRPKRRGSSSR